MTIRPGPHPGAPFEPTGDPMKDGVGPAAWADRADHPDLTLEGEPKIQPMSVLDGFEVESRDPDPRGMPVVGADGVQAGTIVDIWVDRSEPQIRYFTVELAGGEGEVLLPVGYSRIDTRRGQVKVKAIKAEHFSGVPRPKADDRITLLEEDRVVAYYAGGYMYADPGRGEPWL